MSFINCLILASVLEENVFKCSLKLLCNLWCVSDCFPRTSSSCLLMLDIMFGTSRPTRSCSPEFLSTLWESGSEMDSCLFSCDRNRKKYDCDLGCRRILYLENDVISPAGWGAGQSEREHRDRGPEPTSSQSHQRLLHTGPSGHRRLRKRLQGTTDILKALWPPVVHVKSHLRPGPETERAEPPGSEGSEPAQPGVWQRQEVQRQ